jgi:ribosomal protein L11 methyltransferase
VVANILPDPIINAASELRRLTRAGGWLLVSGIVAGRRRDVVEALARAGFRLAEQREQGEWVACVLN